MANKSVEVFVVSTLMLPAPYVEKIKSVSSKIGFWQSNDMAELMGVVGEAGVLLVGTFSREMLLAARKLKWIQTMFAGVDALMLPEIVNSAITVTSAGGVNANPVSDQVIGMMLCLSRKLHVFIRNQTEKKWKTSDRELMDQLDELSGKTLGIVGLGRIGMEIAKKARCFGMRVIATKKNVGSPQPEFVDKLYSAENLNALLAESDFVTIQAPLTKETEGSFGEQQFRGMKKTAYFINAARGRIVKEEALIRALREGWIAGAGLDTFATEPLPRESPLWEMRNVIITPHVAGVTPYYGHRLIDLFCENLKRFLNGEPMINVVDKKRGY